MATPSRPRRSSTVTSTSPRKSHRNSLYSQRNSALFDHGPIYLPMPSPPIDADFSDPETDALESSLYSSLPLMSPPANGSPRSPRPPFFRQFEARERSDQKGLRAFSKRLRGELDLITIISVTVAIFVGVGLSAIGMKGDQNNNEGISLNVPWSILLLQGYPGTEGISNFWSVSQWKRDAREKSKQASEPIGKATEIQSTGLDRDRAENEMKLSEKGTEFEMAVQDLTRNLADLEVLYWLLMNGKTRIVMGLSQTSKNNGQISEFRNQFESGAENILHSLAEHTATLRHIAKDTKAVRWHTFSQLEGALQSPQPCLPICTRASPPLNFDDCKSIDKELQSHCQLFASNAKGALQGMIDQTNRYSKTMIEEQTLYMTMLKAPGENDCTPGSVRNKKSWNHTLTSHDESDRSLENVASLLADFWATIEFSNIIVIGNAERLRRVVSAAEDLKNSTPICDVNRKEMINWRSRVSENTECKVEHD